MRELEDLRASLDRRAGDGLSATGLPGLAVMRASSTTEPIGDMVAPTLAIVAQGAKRTSLNGHDHTYGPGQFLIVSVDLPVVGQIVEASPEAPFLAFVLELRPEQIAALLLETRLPARPGGREPLPLGIAVSDASRELVDAAGRLLALCDAPADAAALAAGVQRELLWRLLTGPQAGLAARIGLADGRLADVASAIRWIRQHYAETLRIEELAARALMSPSSFHRHFRAVTSLTPIQFQKEIRLREARARLLREPGDVAGAGFAVGYDSPSQFSREYRRMFGAPPGRDAVALREQERRARA
jgi:AraC-like DNA-binding protein